MLNEAAQPARRRHVQAMRSALEQARGSLPAVPSRAPFGAAIRLPSAALAPSPEGACRCPLPPGPAPGLQIDQENAELERQLAEQRAVLQARTLRPSPPRLPSPLSSPPSPLSSAQPRRVAAATGGDRRGGRVLVHIPADRRGVRAVAGRPARDLDAQSRAASARICTPPTQGRRAGRLRSTLGRAAVASSRGRLCPLCAVAPGLSLGRAAGARWGLGYVA